MCEKVRWGVGGRSGFIQMCIFIFPVVVSIDESELHTAQSITSLVTLILKKFSILYGTEGFLPSSQNTWLSTDSFHVTTLISQGSYGLSSNLEQLVLICKYQTSVCRHHISIHWFTVKLAFCMATTVTHVTICGSIVFTLVNTFTYNHVPSNSG
jgi:hypothetical protein